MASIQPIHTLKTHTHMRLSALSTSVSLQGLKCAAVAASRLGLPPYVAVIQLPGGSYHCRCTCWTCAIQTLDPSVTWRVAQGPPDSQLQNMKARAQPIRSELKKNHHCPVPSCQPPGTSIFSRVSLLPISFCLAHIYTSFNVKMNTLFCGLALCAPATIYRVKSSDNTAYFPAVQTGRAERLRALWRHTSLSLVHHTPSVTTHQ